jgi:hypothetical protein
LCQIQSPSSGLRYVNYGPGRIQCIYSSIYSDFNIHLNVSALLLYISRQFNARYTANLLPNTAHILQFMLYVLWSRPYTEYLQILIFRPQYSTVGSSPAIGGISTIQSALYWKLGANYCALLLAFAMWTVVATIYNTFTAPHIQSSIFISTYLRCYCRYHINSMRVILHSWCQLQRTSPSFRYVNGGAARIGCIYSSVYSILIIRLNVSALLLEIRRYLHAYYIANFVPNTEPILRFALCELWSRTYTMHLQLRRFRHQYSIEPICATIGDNRICRCAFYC